MRRGGDSGQASVELLAVVPLLVVFALALAQAGLVARSLVAASVSSRAAARAVEVGGDPAAAAATEVPAALGRGVRTELRDGAPRVTVPVPLAGGHRSIGVVSQSGRFGGR